LDENLCPASRALFGQPSVRKLRSIDFVIKSHWHRVAVDNHPWGEDWTVPKDLQKVFYNNAKRFFALPDLVEVRAKEAVSLW